MYSRTGKSHLGSKYSTWFVFIQAKSNKQLFTQWMKMLIHRWFKKKRKKKIHLLLSYWRTWDQMRLFPLECLLSTITEKRSRFTSFPRSPPPPPPPKNKLHSYFSKAPASSSARTHLYVAQQLRPRAPPLIFHLFAFLHKRSSTRSSWRWEHRCTDRPTERRSCCRRREEDPDVRMQWTAAASRATSHSDTLRPHGRGREGCGGGWGAMTSGGWGISINHIIRSFETVIWI